MSNKLLAAAIVTQYDGMCVKAVGLHVFHSPFIFLTVIRPPPSVTYYCIKSLPNSDHHIYQSWS